MNQTLDNPTLPASKLVKHQVKTYGPRFYTERGQQFRITAKVRHDDQCGNGHNSFGITAMIDEKSERGHWIDSVGGCCHDEVAEHFPELAPFIKWHLTSTDGPMHYVANTLYWLGYSGYCDVKQGSPPDLSNARSTAVWLDMPESYLATEATRSGSLRGSLSEQGQAVKEALDGRLLGLLTDFKSDVEKLGLVY